jgi:hypothetical protein
MSQNGPMKRRIDKQTLIVSAGVAVGLVFIVMGLGSGATGRDAQRLPAVIERMSPGPGDQVLQQSQIMVDFVDGYEASLVVDGIELATTRLDELSADGAQPRPGAQVEIPPTAIYDPGNYTISFLPQEGAPITTFSQGTHTATVKFWKVIEGPAKSRSFSWEFDAN